MVAQVWYFYGCKCSTGMSLDQLCLRPQEYIIVVMASPLENYTSVEQHSITCFLLTEGEKLANIYTLE